MADSEQVSGPLPVLPGDPGEARAAREAWGRVHQGIRSRRDGGPGRGSGEGLEEIRRRAPDSWVLPAPFPREGRARATLSRRPEGRLRGRGNSRRRAQEDLPSPERALD